MEKEEKKAGKSKKNKKVSEGENTPTSVPSTPKSDNKPAVDEQQKKSVSNMEKAADIAEKNKIAQTQEKAAVFDELGGNYIYLIMRNYIFEIMSFNGLLMLTF